MTRLRLALLAAPLIAACGIVGYDIASRRMIIDPIDLIVFDSDSGAVEVYAFDRTAVNIIYALKGFDTAIEDVGTELEDRTLQAFIGCNDRDVCNADFYCEVPFGTAIEATARKGDVKFTGVDAEMTVVVTAGNFDGVDLGAAPLDLEVDTGAVTISWISPPTAANITVADGPVTLTLPAGTYQCDLQADDGEVDNQGVTCDPAATAVIAVAVAHGDITLLPAQAP